MCGCRVLFCTFILHKSFTAIYSLQLIHRQSEPFLDYCFVKIARNCMAEYFAIAL